MAARSGKAQSPIMGSYEAMDNMPSNTLKRHPKMELGKSDLIRLLSYLEGELQARDITIAALKTEKAKQLLFQAKYGRFGLGDPFLALQRDSEGHKDNSFDETAIKTMYDNQLTQLENLIATQRKAQHRMREQLCAVEKRYHKVCAELEDEKRKHAQDTAQGDDVTYMLEKERERLKQEVDFEKGQNKKLEKELKKTVTSLEEEQANSNKHKQVAIMLIKERKKLVERLIQSEQLQTLIELSLKEEKHKMRSMAEGLVQESEKSLEMEAALEKQMSLVDLEREQFNSKMMQAEAANQDLVSQVQEMQQQIETLQWQLDAERRSEGPKSIEIKSSVTKPTTKEQAKEVIMNSIERAGVALGVVGVPRTPPASRAAPNKVLKNTPPNTPPEMRKFGLVRESPEREGSPKPNVPRSYVMANHSPTKSPDRTIINDVRVMPVSSVGDASMPRININASGPAGTHVFTTPSGGKISVHVGGPGGTQNRKAVPVGRGTPPPIPPNKPLFLPQNNQQRKDVAQPGGRSPVMRTEAVSPASQSKYGLPLNKDTVQVTSPESPNESVKHFMSGTPRQIPIPVAHHTTSSPNTGNPSSDGMRKSSQVCVNIK